MRPISRASTPTSTDRPQLDTVAPLILVAWVALSYGWTCWFGFINDDYGWIVEARSLVSSGWRPAASSGAFLRPIIHLTFLFNYLINGTAPFGYHLVNVGLEALNTYLVWRLARWVLHAPVESLLVAMLFAGHPSHAGAVTWVCGRTELVADAFYLGALSLHTGRRTLGAAALFALALLSKEGAVTFPLVAVAVDCLNPRGQRWRWSSTAAYVGLLAGYFLLRLALSRTYTAYVGLGVVAHGNLPELARWLGHQLSVMAQSLLEMLPIGPVAAVIALPALTVIALWLAAEEQARRAVRLGTVWMLVTILPFLGVPLLVPRYAYLPSVGLALVVIGGGRGLLARLPRLQWAPIAAAACAAGWLVACAIPAQNRNEQLRRNSVLTRRIIEALVRAVPQPAPHSVFVVDGLGPLRLGRDSWAHTPVFLFCLADAVRLQFEDPTLDAVFPAGPLPPDATRTLIQVRWDAGTGSFLILR